jgi:hypothetical protein
VPVGCAHITARNDEPAALAEIALAGGGTEHSRAIPAGGLPGRQAHPSHIGEAQLAQSQLTVLSLGEGGGAGYWEPTDAVGVQTIEIWSRLPSRQPSPPSLNVVLRPARTDIGHVLAEWRAAQGRLDEHIEASPMRSFIESEISRLRAEYHRLFALALT